MTERSVFVGGDADGNCVYMTVGLETVSGPMETVDHRDVETVTRLSMTGKVHEGHRREPVVAGQCKEALLEVTIPVGFTMEQVHDMHATWDRWHLNDMKAACAHQTVVWETHPRYGYRQPSLDQTPRCPKTGYRYGHAWLYDPLPSDVLAKVKRFIDTGSWDVTLSA